MVERSGGFGSNSGIGFTLTGINETYDQKAMHTSRRMAGGFRTDLGPQLNRPIGFANTGTTVIAVAASWS